MNVDQFFSLFRSALKLVGGYFVAKGVTDASGWEGFIGTVTGLIGLVLSHFKHTDGTNASANGSVRVVVGWVLVNVASSLVAMSLLGCAGFQKHTVTTDPSTGITTTNTVTDINKIASKVKRITKTGTALVLLKNPELRDEFTTAAGELHRIELQDEIDLNDALLIVQRIDPEALNSQEARIYVAFGTAFIEEVVEDVTGEQLTVLSTVEARPIVKALREGIETGLALTQVH